MAEDRVAESFGDLALAPLALARPVDLAVVRLVALEQFVEGLVAQRLLVLAVAANALQHALGQSAVVGRVGPASHETIAEAAQSAVLLGAVTHCWQSCSIGNVCVRNKIEARNHCSHCRFSTDHQCMSFCDMDFSSFSSALTSSEFQFNGFRLILLSFFGFIEFKRIRLG